MYVCIVLCINNFIVYVFSWFCSYAFVVPTFHQVRSTELVLGMDWEALKQTKQMKVCAMLLYDVGRGVLGVFLFVCYLLKDSSILRNVGKYQVQL